MTKCEFCKCEMLEGADMDSLTHFDIVKKEKRPIRICPKCKKWEWC